MNKGEGSANSMYAIRNNSVDYKTLFGEFLSGGGPEFSGFGQNHPMTNDMKTSWIVEEATVKFLLNGKKPLVKYDAPFGILGLVMSGNNTTAQFVGGARISIIPTSYGTFYKLDNTTDRHSFRLHMSSSVQRNINGDLTSEWTMYQRFMWLQK